ncbi:MAG: 3-dehydroquinate synthase [Myxococcota bacterium]
MSEPVPSGQRHLFVVGFMATGKSTVGRLVAERLSLPFVDLDERIEADAGRAIAAIFASDGEDGFRRLEAESLARVIAGPPAVVATGGGAPCHRDNLARMRAAGLVVALTAPLATVRARVPDPATRPLLQQPDEAVAALYQRRVTYYRQAHACVRTEDDPPEVVARAVADLFGAARSIPERALADATLVALSARAYPIIVATKTLDQLGILARAALGDSCTRLGVITDDNVGPLYGERVRAALGKAGFAVSSASVPAGEPSKCFEQLSRLTQDMVTSGLDRRSAIIALGGGVVGDLAGLVAATLFRGIDYIQVPTTILAMVDSAIGGKTGINIPAGKNLVGAFWQPRAVLADPEVLITLPVRERRAAFGELVKYGLLDSDDLYASIDALGPAIGSEAELPEQLSEVIRRCAAVKSWIVSRDEREQTGERALLNLGHTVGHAIEASAGYGTLLHGEAVALGLVAAARLSARLGLCDAAVEAQVVDTLRRAGLDADVDPWLRDDVLARIGVDKKRTGTKVSFIFIKRFGECFTRAISIAEIARILRV